MSTRKLSMFHEMVSSLKEDHISALPHMRALNISTHQLVHEIGGAVCEYARSLQDNPRRCAEFYAEAFPKRFQRFHPRKLLLHVMMYFHGATSRNHKKYSTASAHSVALREVYNNRDIVGEDIVHYIEAQGGFAGLPGGDETDNCNEAELPKQEDDDHTQEQASPRRAKSASIFSDQDDDDLVTGDEETEQENGTSEEANNIVRLPVRKPAKPAVSLPRLPWRYVERCIQARPRNAVEREAVLGPLRDGKDVWVKLTPGKQMEFELYKGGGAFIDTPITGTKVEDD